MRKNNLLTIVGKIFASSLAVAITAWILPGVTVESYLSALIVAVVLSLLNIFLKPVLVFLTIPVTLFSFGLFLLVINALIILLADDLVGGFIVDGFWWALLFSIILSIINAIFNSIDNKSNGGNKDEM